MPNRRLLIITYYWPPAGGIAVRRWLMMSRLLAEMGWNVHVVTSANPDYPQLDPALESSVHPSISVIRIPGFEPRNLLKKLLHLFSKQKEVNLDNTLNQSSKKQSVFQKITLWVRSNMFIPDARVGWSKSVIKKLPGYMAEINPDCIISTGPPHSTHLAALAIAEKYRLKWIADFRDPWMEIEFFDKLALTNQAMKSHVFLEKKVLTSADIVTTVSPAWAHLFETKGAKRTAVIYNGYDNVLAKAQKNYQETHSFIISHVGTLGPDRMVPALFNALRKVANSEPAISSALKFIVVGNTAPAIIEVIHEKALQPFFENPGFVDLKEAQDIMQASSLLLLIQNKVAQNIKGRIPAKVFEYMSTGNDILMIGDPDSDLATILKEYPNAYVAGFEDQSAIQKAIKKSFENRHESRPLKSIEMYSRKAAATSLNLLIEELISKEISD